MAGDSLCLFDIPAQLFDQFTDIRKSAGIAKPVKKIDGHSCAAKLALNADQMDFHLACLFAECGIRSDVDGRWAYFRAAKSAYSINAVAGYESFDLFQVRSRKADCPAAPLTADYRAPET